MSRYVDFVLRHRVLVAAACLTVTVLAAWNLTRATVGTSLAKLVLGASPEFRRHQELVERFGNDEQLVVAWEEADLEGAPARLGPLVERLEQLEQVRRVHSVVGMPDFARSALADGILVSGDGRHLAVIVELRADESRSLEGTPALVREITTLFDEAGFDEETLHLAGLPAVMAEIDTQTRRNISRLTPAVMLLILLTTWLLLRRPWPVVMTTIVGLVAIVWTMGFAILLDRNVNVLLAATPAMILLISFSDVVHLYNAYLIELRSGRDHDAAIRASVGEVGRACLYTSATTFVGFLGIALINVPLFRSLGVVLGFGVAIALLLAITLVPIMLSALPAPRVTAAPRGPGVLTPLIGGLERLATGRPRTVIAVFAVLMAIAVAGTLRIEIETDFTKRMKDDNRLAVDTAYFHEHFSGVSNIDLYVTLPPDAEAAAALATCAETLRGLGPVARVMYSPQPGRFADPEAGLYRFVVFVRPDGMYDIFRAGEEARRAAAAALGDGAEVEVTGFLYLAGHWLDTNLVTQVMPLGVSLVIIGLMMMVVVRSVPVGLLAMVPNVIPLLAVCAVLGFVWHPTDSDAVITLLVAIGIAVDDTIHFMIRYRIERRRTATSREAVHRTFTYAGRAIATTSLIFAIGFAPFAISDYLSIRMMGVLLPLAMLVALAGDLLLLPALVVVGERGILRATERRSEHA